MERPSELDRDLGLALSHGLNLPTAALRASMEALARELSLRHRESPLAEGALAEIELIHRNVEKLMEYFAPEPARPMRCTLEEIAIGARAELPRESRGRVVLASAHPGASLVVDGPLLSRTLRKLTENALEAGSADVLLVTRRTEEDATFTVVADCREDFDPSWSLAAFHSTKPNHLGLGLSLARRDVERLQGALELRHTASKHTQAVIRVPLRPNASPAPGGRLESVS